MGTEVYTVKAVVVVIMKRMLFLVAMCLSAQTLAADGYPSECDTARDRAKSKYGSLRHYFDALNQCMSRNNDEASQCKAALSEQQTALGDFIFAQRVASDVCGRAGKNPDLS